MQSTYQLKLSQVTPKPGYVFGEAILGEYEAACGIIVVKDMKRNPGIFKIKVLKVGGSFKRKKGKKWVPGIYWTKPGQTAWMKKATATRGVVIVQGKSYVFLDNDDIVGAL